MTQKSKSEPEIPELPALRNFLRGYFHQDMKDEYGSAENAARTFSADANENERAALARDWQHFLEHTCNLPLVETNRLLTGLGSSYSLTADEVRQISEILRQGK